MVVHITLQDIQELNQIRNLIISGDLDNQKLGVNLFRTHRLVSGDFHGLLFKTDSGKQIPINWYFKKIDEAEVLNTQNVPVDGRYFGPGSLLPIIEALIKGESRFSTNLVFRFDHIYNEDEIRNRQGVAINNAPMEF